MGELLANVGSCPGTSRSRSNRLVANAHHAISDCLPIFSAAGHPNYLKSAYLYLQKMVTLESDNPAVFHKFVNGFYVIRRSSLRYSFLAKKVATAKTFLTPERRTYLQVMEWLGKNDGMQPTEWGWAVQGENLSHS